MIDDVIGELPAFVEALVNNRTLFPHLREEISIEARVTSSRRIRHMYIRNLAARGFIDATAILLDPIQMAKIFFALHRNNRHLAGIFAIRVCSDLQNDLLAGSLFEEAVNVIGGMQFAAIDCEDVVSRFDVYAGLSEWSFIARVPVLSVIDLGDAVMVIFQSVVCAQQSAFELLRLGSLATGDEHVPNRHFAEAFLKQICEFLARGNSIQIWGVFLPDPFQIQAVIVRIVKEIALDAPSFVVNLFP